MSKIEFDMRISGDVEKTVGDQNVTNFKMNNYKFSKQDNENINAEEAADAIVSMTNGLIRSIAPSFVKDENDTYTVDEVVRVIVSKLALTVGVDPQALMLAALRTKIEGRDNEQ